MKFKPSAHAIILSVALFFSVLGGYGTPYVLAVSPNEISIDIAPANPSPNENTTVTLSSFAANLDSVLITWSVNGRTVISGIGKKSFSFDSGKQGTATRVDARISMPDGTISKGVSISPSVMVLLWEATDSYVPPFYKGKALLSEGSEVKVVAMPEIQSGKTLISPKNMTYSWQKDFTNEQNANGYGKNSFTFITDYLEKTATVSVEASTINQEFSSAGSMNTFTTTPEISFYRKDADLGITWEEALSEGHTITSSDATEVVVAIPYFISPKETRDPTLIFTWRINDEMVTAKNYLKNMMPLKVEGGVSGSAKLRLDIENTEKIFQTAKKEITLNF